MSTGQKIDVLHEIRYIRFLVISAHNIYMKLIEKQSQTSGRHFTADQVNEFKEQAFKLKGVSEGIDITLQIMDLTHQPKHFTANFQSMVSEMVIIYTKSIVDSGSKLTHDDVILKLRTNFELAELNNASKPALST